MADPRRLKQYGRRRLDRMRGAASMFIHFFLWVAMTWWIVVMASIGLAEVINDICHAHQSNSSVCRGIKNGLVTE